MTLIRFSMSELMVLLLSKVKSTDFNFSDENVFRLKEHVEDEDKLPILIFPEGESVLLSLYDNSQA